MGFELTVADLNTVVNHEPRIEDERLAVALGFKRPADIRELIERHEMALQRFGEVIRTVRETSAKGGRPGKTYWLNKRQALYLCTKSEADNAVDLTIEMVELFARFTGALLAPTTSAPVLKPGQALIPVGKRHVLVDTRRFERLRDNEKAVVVEYDGRIAISQVSYDAHPNWYGRRSAQGPWRKLKPGEHPTAKVVRSPVQVIGVIVEEQPLLTH